MGERVRAFELAFAAAHDAPDAVAVSSCTAGLHLVLAALGVGPGDEVLVPSLSFVATANCALYVGATPVFVDIAGLEQPLMSPADAADKCTRRTKAVVVMHYAGHLADRDSWRRFVGARGLILVEDAAHAAGAPGAGSFGDAAAFSFYGNKNMTTAEGGMVLARDPAILDRVRQLRSHGMTSGTLQRLAERAPAYDVTMLGWNYRMDEFRAAIGLAQLRSLHRWNERRAALARQYRSALAVRCPEVSVPFADASWPSAHHILPAILPNGARRETVMGWMRDAGVQTTVHYPPIHQLAFYRNKSSPSLLPRTEEYARRELTLPLHPKMVDGDVSKAVDALAGALSQEPAGVVR
jgi:dTDP-4-amino-4,6-dideoxygalactose transaminase